MTVAEQQLGRSSILAAYDIFSPVRHLYMHHQGWRLALQKLSCSALCWLCHTFLFVLGVSHLLSDAACCAGLCYRVWTII
jgi:hypothetical protein